MQVLVNLLVKEPAVFIAAVVAVLNLAVGLGLLSDTDAEMLATMAESLVVIAGGLLVRGLVTPVRR